MSEGRVLRKYTTPLWALFLSTAFLLDAISVLWLRRALFPARLFGPPVAPLFPARLLGPIATLTLIALTCLLDLDAIFEHAGGRTSLFFSAVVASLAISLQFSLLYLDLLRESLAVGIELLSGLLKAASIGSKKLEAGLLIEITPETRVSA